MEWNGTESSYLPSTNTALIRNRDDLGKPHSKINSERGQSATHHDADLKSTIWKISEKDQNGDTISGGDTKMGIMGGSAGILERGVYVRKKKERPPKYTDRDKRAGGKNMPVSPLYLYLGGGLGERRRSLTESPRSLLAIIR